MGTGEGKMVQEIYDKALAILHEAYGEDADFHPGQYDAIEATLTNRRTLVVQKTGWGKSLVYFISAKMTKGITLVVSPLLVLMNNQREAAGLMKLSCIQLNGNLTGEIRSQVLKDIGKGLYKVVFTTPETLYKNDVQKVLKDVEIGLFVVDECHCISDWGHDFRLEYGMLKQVIDRLPENVPVLGTTATANDRVIEDLKKQFGENVFLSRGPLTRESLHIEILKLPTRAERYIWLKDNLKKLPGTGIIYCLTHSDCANLSEYLNAEGYQTRPYYSESSKDKFNLETEKLLKNNEVKAVVATTKLGMGYDKKDIGFVVHFQTPPSLVAYYQQIGRAGRADGAEAYCYLMTGEEDRRIHEYFISKAFPTEAQERAVVDALTEHADGLRKYELSAYSNIATKALDKTIAFLLKSKMIYFGDERSPRLHRAPVPYSYPGAQYEAVREMKTAELNEMGQYLSETGCLSKFVVNSLNDYTAKVCGKCRNCLGEKILATVTDPDPAEVEQLKMRMNSKCIPIPPRKKWPENDNGFDPTVKMQKLNEEGIALAKYGASGYGEMVAFDKYHAEDFREELVARAAEVLQQKLRDQGYAAITNIPSGRNLKVKNFAMKLAERTGIPYMDLLSVTGSGEQQKNMQNSTYQFRNAKEKLKLEDGAHVPAKVILVDDMVDSRWTLTVAGRLLQNGGAQNVFPFCLADSSVND
jgi:ATP-dependent DNA helicase RecQ